MALPLPRPVTAGPPFATDDPDPTPYRHWEIYLGGTYENGIDGVESELPFGEFNYGLMPNVQASLTLPFEYEHALGRATYGYGETELAVKVRFLQERGGAPQVAFYPEVVLPTSAAGGFTQVFLPLWLQKSWGPWTAFGGAGRWHNPGRGNLDWTFSGLALVRSVSDDTSLGAEIFHSSPRTVRGAPNTGFNAGLLKTHGEHHAIVLSAGRGADRENTLSAYAAYELMLGR